MQKVEGYLVDGKFFTSQKEAEEHAMVTELIDRLTSNNVISSYDHIQWLDVGRAIRYVVENYELKRKTPNCK